MTIDTTSQKFFEDKYNKDKDPWDFASNPYELDRYQSIMNSIAGRRFQCAYEPGCSVGVLTRELAQFCNRVDAIDISSTAVAQAQHQCRDCVNTYITCGSLQHHNYWVKFDLLIFSEIGYYFEEQILRNVLSKLLRQLEPHGTMVACHWLGSSPDHILSGDRVHHIIGEFGELVHQQGMRTAGFRLDRWMRKP